MRESADLYESGEYRWWHLTDASPELVQALADGWMWPPGPAVDLGCGLGVEARHLASAGFQAVGVDVSGPAIREARQSVTRAQFLQADVTSLPFQSASFRFLLDRGCFHYLAADQRKAYEEEARRVLVRGGRLLLRACLRIAGTRNDIDEDVLRRTFERWHFARIDRTWIPSDTRKMEAVIARLEIPA